MMHPQSCSSRPQVLRVQMYMTITVVLLASWQMSSDATSVRCSTDLLSDIMFVCGDRGTYSSESILSSINPPEALPVRLRLFFSTSRNYCVIVER